MRLPRHGDSLKVLGTRTQRTLDEELNGTRLALVKHARERERELRPA